MKTKTVILETDHFNLYATKGAYTLRMVDDDHGPIPMASTSNSKEMKGIIDSMRNELYEFGWQLTCMYGPLSSLIDDEKPEEPEEPLENAEGDEQNG